MVERRLSIAPLFSDFWKQLTNDRGRAYVLTYSALIFVYLSIWLSGFNNIYGWLTDDIYQFARIKDYELGGSHLLDIQWFHAFDWFIVLFPWLFHWNVKSFMIPQAWERTGEFRALILYVIVLHAVVLAQIAHFLRLLCSSSLVCIGALVLVMTSPTFVFYTDLLDSRYLGLVAGLPALITLLSQHGSVSQRLPKRAVIVGFAIPGFLIGLGQSIHYTLLYFAGPVAFIYWCQVLLHSRNRYVWIKLLAFVAGLLAWFIPVQLLSLDFHQFPESMLGTLIFQVQSLGSRYLKIVDDFTWVHFFFEDMGLPLMFAVIAGALLIARKRTRPAFISASHAGLMLWSTFIATLYLALTPSVAFYRQVCAFQVFYALFAIVALDAVIRIMRLKDWTRLLVASLLFLIIAFVPSILRMPEVFVAAQGLGRAVNYAHAIARENGVYFIQLYDYDLHPHAIIGRSDFDHLKSGDVIVTDFPVLYFAKYPDLFAIMHDARPVASFPTEWCTVENWVEERTFWYFRRYQDEPESCNAQVYRVDDIRRQQQGKRLDIAELRADSALTPTDGPSQVFIPQNPAVPLDPIATATGVTGAHFWSSDKLSGPHWLQITFRRLARVDAVTIVPTNYFAAPGTVDIGRPDAVQVFASATKGAPLKLLWSATGLRDSAIVTARFPATSISTLKIQLSQPPAEPLNEAIVFDQRLPASPVAGIESIHIPGYVLNLPASARITIEN